MAEQVQTEILKDSSRYCAECGEFLGMICDPFAPTSCPNGCKQKDTLLPEAERIIRETGNTTITNLQRILKLGYNRCARIIEQLETDGVLSEMKSGGEREIYPPSEATN